MCTHTCIHAHTSTHTCTHTHIYTQAFTMDICTHTQVHTCTRTQHTHTYAHTHIGTDTCIHMQPHTCAHTCKRTESHICICTATCARTYAHPHICVPHMDARTCMHTSCLTSGKPPTFQILQLSTLSSPPCTCLSSYRRNLANLRKEHLQGPLFLS